MYYCTDCNIYIEDPKFKNFKVDAGTQKVALCPACGARLAPFKPEFCRYCGRKLTAAASGAYCDETCRRLGKKLWTRELVRRRKIKDDPLARILRLLTNYNREHGTNLSYGKFVAFVLPGLKTGKGKAYGY